MYKIKYQFINEAKALEENTLEFPTIGTCAKWIKEAISFYELFKLVSITFERETKSVEVGRLREELITIGVLKEEIDKLNL